MGERIINEHQHLIHFGGNIRTYEALLLETIKVQNIVGNADLRLQEDEFLDLVAFYEEHNVWSTYQPNMFPGLIYRPTDIPIVLLLFYSGKIVITGAKTMQGVHDGWAQLHDLVKSFVRVKSSNRER